MAHVSLDEIVRRFEALKVDVVYSDQFIAVSLCGNLGETLDLVLDQYVKPLSEIEQKLIAFSFAYGVSPPAESLDVIAGQLAKIERILAGSGKIFAIIRAPDSIKQLIAKKFNGSISLYSTLPEAIHSLDSANDPTAELQQFQQSAIYVFAEQFGVTVKAQNMEKITTSENLLADQVLGIVPLISDSTSGNLILRFTSNTIEALAEKALDKKLKVPHQDVLEVAGELANMILGNAKEELNRRGYGLQQVLPQMFCSTENNRVDLRTSLPFWKVDFDSSAGPFSMELALKTIL